MMMTIVAMQLPALIAWTAGWAAVAWGRGRWGGEGKLSWARERQDRGSAALLQAVGINLAVEALHRVHLSYALSQARLPLTKHQTRT